MTKQVPHAWNRILLPWLAFAGILLLFCVGSLIWISTIAATNKYLGTWNYDQPNYATHVNIAQLNGDGGGYRSGVPQIGTVTFSRSITGEILGRTDQGCTWRFTAHTDSLQLSSTNQYCFNRVVNLGYNIYYWKVSITGNHEQEVLKATSYLPNGTFDFVLQNGRRTKSSDENLAASTQNFVGTWKYKPADIASQDNIMIKVHFPTDGIPSVTREPVAGTVRFTKGSEGKLIATTDNGCRWTLEVHGNTAALLPSKQICHLPQGTQKLHFFTIASDGQQQTSMMSGMDEKGNIFQLIIGALVKTTL